MTNLLMIGTPEMLVIGIVILLLFGGKKIPELMRGLGAGIKSFQDGMKEGEKKPDSSKETDKKEE